MELDQNFWESKYRSNETGWDVGEVSTPLKQYFNQLTNKSLKILIPGAGNAYEAEYLIKHGFENVYVCDLAETALNNLADRVPELQSKFLLRGNFFELTENGFDLIIEQTFFCALQPSLRRKYFEQMHNLLAPGGRLAGLLFDDTLNKDKPPFGGSATEYRDYFNDLFCAHTFERCYNSITPRTGRELFINLVKIEGQKK